MKEKEEDIQNEFKATQRPKKGLQQLHLYKHI